MNSVKIFEEFIKLNVINIKKTDNGNYIFCHGLSCGKCEMYSEKEWCDRRSTEPRNIDIPFLSETQLLKLQEKYPEVFI